MIKKEKQELVNMLQPMFDGKHLYILDCEGLKASQTYLLRYQLYQEKIQCRQIPNALLRILLANTAYGATVDILQKSSLILFVKENPKRPAEIIETFRKKQKTDKPVLKGAFVHEEIFLGEKSLQQLMKIKSRKELIADIVGLLLSPGRQLVNLLRSSGDKLYNIMQIIKNK